MIGSDKPPMHVFPKAVSMLKADPPALNGSRLAGAVCGHAAMNACQLPDINARNIAIFQ
jgi:hypothetical protein